MTTAKFSRSKEKAWEDLSRKRIKICTQSLWSWHVLATLLIMRWKKGLMTLASKWSSKRRLLTGKSKIRFCHSYNWCLKGRVIATKRKTEKAKLRIFFYNHKSTRWWTWYLSKVPSQRVKCLNPSPRVTMQINFNPVHSIRSQFRKIHNSLLLRLINLKKMTSWSLSLGYKDI